MDVVVPISYVEGLFYFSVCVGTDTSHVLNLAIIYTNDKTQVAEIDLEADYVTNYLTIKTVNAWGDPLKDVPLKMVRWDGTFELFVTDSSGKANFLLTEEKDKGSFEVFATPSYVKRSASLFWGLWGELVFTIF